MHAAYHFIYFILIIIFLEFLNLCRTQSNFTVNNETEAAEAGGEESFMEADLSDPPSTSRY